MQRQQDCAAAEQGSGGKEKTSHKIARPMAVRLELEILPAPHAHPLQNRKQQYEQRDQQRAMKETLEIDAGEKLRRERVRRPEQQRRNQRTEEDAGRKVNEQSGCVLQACYCKVLA